MSIDPTKLVISSSNSRFLFGLPDDEDQWKSSILRNGLGAQVMGLDWKAFTETVVFSDDPPADAEKRGRAQPWFKRLLGKVPSEPTPRVVGRVRLEDGTMGFDLRRHVQYDRRRNELQRFANLGAHVTTGATRGQLVEAIEATARDSGFLVMLCHHDWRNGFEMSDGFCPISQLPKLPHGSCLIDVPSCEVGHKANKMKGRLGPSIYVNLAPEPLGIAYSLMWYVHFIGEVLQQPDTYLALATRVDKSFEERGWLKRRVQ